MDPSGLEQLFRHLPAWALVLARITAFMAVAPLIGGPWMPFTARALLCVALAIIVAPAAERTLAAPPPLDVGFILLAAQEAMVGLCLGWLLSLAVHGVRMGGDLINRYAGFQAAENFDPSADVGEGPFGDLMHVAIVFIILAAGLHLGMIAALAGSYADIPIGGFAFTAAGLDLVAREVQGLNHIALLLSMPVLAAVMAVTVAEGVLVRAVPQINVLHISFAVKIGVSVLVMSAAMPAVVAFLGVVVHRLQGLAATAARSFA